MKNPIPKIPAWYLTDSAKNVWMDAYDAVEEAIARDRATKKELEYNGARAYRDRRNAA